MVFNKYCSKINNLPLIVGNKNEDQEEQANPNDGQAKDSQILNLLWRTVRNHLHLFCCIRNLSLIGSQILFYTS